MTTTEIETGSIDVVASMNVSGNVVRTSHWHRTKTSDVFIEVSAPKQFTAQEGWHPCPTPDPLDPLQYIQIGPGRTKVVLPETPIESSLQNAHINTSPDIAEEVKGATIRQSIRFLSEAMQSDEDLAWTWHCNIAMPIYDQGVDRKTANLAAVRLMSNLFKCDTTELVRRHCPDVFESPMPNPRAKATSEHWNTQPEFNGEGELLAPTQPEQSIDDWVAQKSTTVFNQSEPDPAPAVTHNPNFLVIDTVWQAPLNQKIKCKNGSVRTITDISDTFLEFLFEGSPHTRTASIELANKEWFPAIIIPEEPMQDSKVPAVTEQWDIRYHFNKWLLCKDGKLRKPLQIVGGAVQFILQDQQYSASRSVDTIPVASFCQTCLPATVVEDN